jgi:cell division protease FtsH
MHAMAAALLEREVLDANEIKALVEGRQMPTRINPPSSGNPVTDEVQQVLKPEPSGRPNLAPGERPSPA